MKIRLLAILLFWSSAISAANKYSQLFQFDERAVEKKFQEIDQLENFLNLHEGESMLLNIQRKENLGYSNQIFFDTTTINAKANRPLGIPSFCWGGCLSFAGVVIVYYETNSEEEAIKALVGSGTGIVAAIAMYVISAETIYLFDWISNEIVRQRCCAFGS